MTTVGCDANQAYKSEGADGIQGDGDVIAVKLGLSITVVRDGGTRILEIVKNPEMVLNSEGQPWKEEKTRW